MPAPVTVKIALAATYLDGSPARGALSLTYDGGPLAAGQIGVYPARVRADITPQDVDIDGETVAAGYAQISVPASNDASLLGHGGTYTATVDLHRGGAYTTTFLADKDTLDGVIWLSRLQAIDPKPGTPVSVVTFENVKALAAEAVEVASGSMIVDARRAGSSLELVRKNGQALDLGVIRGERGEKGDPGAASPMRVDTTSGTRNYSTIDGTEYLLSASTGRRNVYDLLIGGFMAAWVFLAREGSMVTLEVTDLRGPAGDFIRLPPGFHTRDWTQFWGGAAGTVGSKGPRGAGAGVFYVTAASQKSQFVCTWYTDDPWPTELPGRPA